MLDPQGDFFDEGGVKLMLEDIPTEIRESLNLAWFREVQGQDALPGTIIRLPLRTEHHRRKISSKTVSPQEVEDHFQAFVQKEMDICLLFLSSLQSVEFWVIREGDTTPSRIALSSITPVVDASPNNIVLSRQVETTLYSSPSHGKDWLIRWHSVPNSESQDQLSTRIGCDVRSTMEVEKLVATVALAIQTSVSPDGCCAPGRLFTYLPLPSDTNYPCNVHAPFALTIDRQTLRNENEEGLLDGSDDQYVFSTGTLTCVDSITASVWSGIGTCLIPWFPWPGRNFYSTFPSSTSVCSQRGHPRSTCQVVVPIGSALRRKLLGGSWTTTSLSGLFKGPPCCPHTTDMTTSLLLRQTSPRRCWMHLLLLDWLSPNLPKGYTIWHT